MTRAILILLVALALAPGTWLRAPVPAPDASPAIVLAPVAAAARPGQLGPFRLAGVWEMTSANTRFGGYSALLPLAGGGRLLALSDKGERLEFSPPGSAALRPEQDPVLPAAPAAKQGRDIESAARDPASGRIWLALEGRNELLRLGAERRPEAARAPPEMRGWANNTGPEAMVRLGDGRFIVLSEAFAAGRAAHPALLFARDPTLPQRAAPFTFAGVAGYRPTDMAALPDGRVLVLMRRLVWPMPARFAGKIVLADPAAIRPGQPWQAQELADLAPPLPVDNFEALAVVPGAGGRVTVWLMSDNNDAATQRTLLWRLDLRLADLPR